MTAWTKEDVERIQKRRQSAIRETLQAVTAKKSKHGNVRVLVDLGPDGEIVGGHLRLIHLFDSGKEAKYFEDLKLLRKAGKIRDLRLQEPFALQARRPDGTPLLVGEWRADFVYTAQPSGERHIVDAKGMKTQMYQLKKKIVEANYGVQIEEV